jgi:hypothetical protein
MKTSTGLSLGAFLFLGLLGIIPTAIVYGELRQWTNSVWPPLIIHTSANVFFDSLILQRFFSYTSPANEILFSPGLYGLVVIGINLGFGLWLYRLRMRKNQAQQGGAHA